MPRPTLVKKKVNKQKARFYREEEIGGHQTNPDKDNNSFTPLIRFSKDIISNRNEIDKYSDIPPAEKAKKKDGINDESQGEFKPEQKVFTQTFDHADIYVPSIISNLLQMKHHIGERSPPE